MSENANTNKGLQKIPLCTYKRILHCDCICQSTLHKWRLLGRRKYNITKRTVSKKNSIDNDSLSLFNIYITSQFFQ